MGVLTVQRGGPLQKRRRFIMAASPWCGIICVMKASPESEQPPLELEETQLCTSCMAANLPAAHFCIKCGAPLSSYAATGPFESLFAEGYVYREATEHPRKLIVVLGIWAIFGTVAIISTATLLFSPATGFSGETVIGGLLLSISAMILWKTTRNYRSGKREQREAHH
jgi:hypothetical protein